MNDPKHSPLERVARATAVAIGCGVVGTGGVLLSTWLFGVDATSLLVPPVAVAAWFAGPVLAVVTIATQTLLTLLVMSPVRGLSVSPGAFTQVLIAATVGMAAAVAVGYVRRLHRRYTTIVHSTSEGIWVIDADGRTTFVNEAMADM